MSNWNKLVQDLDQRYMRRALQLAALGKGRAGSNPMVGAVLVYNGKIIGEGWHKQFGQNHAEIDCLESVAEEDKKHISESTLYVTLEPCSHFGKTPPCADRIIREGIKKVIVCNHDPFTEVAGKGIAKLKAAGTDVVENCLASEGRWLNRRFFCLHEKKRPYVILKWAQSQDGYLAPKSKVRTQLSNPLSKSLLHKWRTEEAAIMVGTQTALQDNPELTARLHLGPQPLRIFTDTNLQVPRVSHLYSNEVPTWVLNGRKEEVEGQSHFIKIENQEQLIPQLFTRLYDAGITSLIVEGGAALLTTFIKSGNWDEARIFTGNTMLEDGIAAPLLKRAKPIFSTQIAEDFLCCFINKDAGLEYPIGMGL